LQLILESKRDSSGSGYARALVKRLSIKRVKFLNYLSYSYLLKQILLRGISQLSPTGHYNGRTSTLASLQLDMPA